MSSCFLSSLVQYYGLHNLPTPPKHIFWCLTHFGSTVWIFPPSSFTYHCLSQHYIHMIEWFPKINHFTPYSNMGDASHVTYISLKKVFHLCGLMFIVIIYMNTRIIWHLHLRIHHQYMSINPSHAHIFAPKL